MGNSRLQAIREMKIYCHDSVSITTTGGKVMCFGLGYVQVRVGDVRQKSVLLDQPDCVAAILVKTAFEAEQLREEIRKELAIAAENGRIIASRRSLDALCYDLPIEFW